MSFKRSERVSELLRHEISNYVQHISDPRLGFVTVTGVRLSDDLNDAKVFYSVYGTDEEKETSSQILNGIVSDLRHVMGKKLESLRRIPSLQFVYDDTAEKAQRVGLILDQLAKERGGDETPAEGKKRQTAPEKKTQEK